MNDAIIYPVIDGAVEWAGKRLTVAQFMRVQIRRWNAWAVSQERDAVIVRPLAERPTPERPEPMW
jgi:hypothetical protein